MRIEFGTAGNFAHKPALMLRQLKNESGCALYNEEFEQWALREWKIKFLHENEMYPDHLTGLEMPDEVFTVLALKYNLTVNV